MEDVIVVGAGPAGAAAALAARRAAPESRVLVLDRAAFPRDKPCGDGIAPHAVDVLAALGAAGAVDGYAPVRRLEVAAPSGRVVARDARRVNWVIPRAVFDARILEVATRQGARFLRERVTSVEQRADHVVVNGRLSARVLVAADGANSTVRRRLGLAPNPPDHLAVAVRGYAPAPAGHPTQRIVMGADGWPSYAWSFPIGDGRANVGYGRLKTRLDGPASRLHDQLDRLLGGADADPATLRGHHLPFSSRRPPPAVGRVLLAGDAASLVNPLSGEGIYYALACGRMAGVAAVTAPQCAGPRYTAALRALLGRHHRHMAVLFRLNRRTWMAESAVAAAARSQGAFDDLVELTLGHGTVGPRLATGVVRALVSAG